MADDNKALNELLQTLQLNLLVVYFSQCSTRWGETDSIPSYNKLYFIRDGEGWIHIDGKDYYPKPGQLVLIPAGSKISFSAISDHPYLKYWCHFTSSIGPLDLFQWIDVPHVIDCKQPDLMIRLFQSLIELNENDSIHARLRERAVLLTMISEYLHDIPLEIRHDRNDEMDRLSEIQDYLENHLHTSIRVQQLAEQVHLHPNYFITYFKKHFGVTPIKYVNRKRVDKAKTLLLTTSLSIKEIANMIGMDEPNRFNKFFRKETGFSPSEYRSQHAHQYGEERPPHSHNSVPKLSKKVQSSGNNLQ